MRGRGAPFSRSSRRPRRPGGVGDAVDHVLGHRGEQVLLGREVAVQRTGLDVHRLGEPAHGQCVEAGLVQQVEGGLDGAGPVESGGPTSGPA